MNIIEFIKRLICGERLPIWSYGLECEVCQMTFVSEKSHYNYVKVNGIEKEHQNNTILSLKKI